MKIHVSVEGNIAAGKSTFCNKLKEYFESKNLPVEVAPEPIEEWVAWRTASGPVNLLQKQYEDPVNNAVHFQLAALVSKCEQLNSFSETKSLITERSLESQRKVFIPLLKNSGYINDLDISILDRLFEQICKSEAVKPDLYVYLKTSPAVAMSRAEKRGRPEEKMVELDLLTRLHELHENWLERDETVPVLVVLADAEPPDPETVYSRIISILKK